MTIEENRAGKSEKGGLLGCFSRFNYNLKPVQRSTGSTGAENAINYF